MGIVGSSWGGDVEEEAVRLEERMGGDRARGRRKGTVSLVFGVGRGVELGLEESGVSGEETRPKIGIAFNAFNSKCMEKIVRY